MFNIISVNVNTRINSHNWGAINNLYTSPVKRLEIYVDYV